MGLKYYDEEDFEDLSRKDIAEIANNLVSTIEDLHKTLNAKQELVEELLDLLYKERGTGG